MFEKLEVPRPESAGLFETLRALSAAEFEERCVERDRSLRDRGVTFAHSGEEIPFPLDPVPRLIDSEEWTTLEGGIVQRVQASRHFCTTSTGRVRSSRIESCLDTSS